MSKKSIEKELYRIPMKRDNEYRVISVHKQGRSKCAFIITGINEKEYKSLNETETLNIVREHHEFTIYQDNVICYGDINFNNGSEDCEALDEFNWLDNLIFKGVPIPSNYDYETHECVSNKKTPLSTETFRISTFCRYLHSCIGKPKFTLIFMEIV